MFLRLLRVTFDIFNSTTLGGIAEWSDCRQGDKNRKDPDATDDQDGLFVRQFRSQGMNDGEIPIDEDWIRKSIFSLAPLTGLNWSPRRWEHWQR